MRREGDVGGLGKEIDRIGAEIACLDTGDIPFTLVSTAGFHCEVWRSSGRIVIDGDATTVDFVLKCYRESCRLAQVMIYGRHYRELRQNLGNIIPPALFVATRIDDAPSVIVLAQNCNPWFNLAHPGNEDEVLPMLRRMPIAARQLRRFVRYACALRDASPSRVVDLHGEHNLVLDRRYRVRYLDSFGVFFFPDVMHTVSDVDEMLARRIGISLSRIEYLEGVLAKLTTPCSPRRPAGLPRS